MWTTPKTPAPTKGRAVDKYVDAVDIGVNMRLFFGNIYARGRNML